MPSAEALLLPNTVRPKKYRLTLHPDTETFTFKGSRVLTLMCGSQRTG